MPNIIYRFDNTPFGGNQNVTLSIDEMPDWFPKGQEVKRNLIRGNRGKLWSYTWYRKERVRMGFFGVGTAIVGTMGSLASEDVPFLWYKDTTTNMGTGTMMFVGDAFEYTPLTPEQNDFVFEMEALQ